MVSVFTGVFVCTEKKRGAKRDGEDDDVCFVLDYFPVFPGYNNNITGRSHNALTQPRGYDVLV